MSRAATVAVFAFGVALCATGTSCKDDASPSGPNIRQCGLVIWHKPASAQSRVEIVGDWNQWKRPGITPDSHPDGWRVTGVDTTAGEHAYAIIEDGVWLTNRNEPMTGQYEDHEVSVGTAEDCNVPAVRVDSVEMNSAGDANVHVTFLSSKSGAKIDPASVVARRRDGSVITTPAIDPATGRVGFALRGLERGKYTYTIEAKDTTGKAAEDARATVWIDGTGEAWDPRDAIVYQVVLDRFRGPNGPLKPPATPSSRAGGTLAGVRNSLDEIQALGATALWLSPLYTNPDGDFPNKDGTHTSTSYHGYWPINSRGIDPKVATEEELASFVTEAHQRGIRVLFDVVPNHVHEQHPWMKEHADWFKQDCVCGEGTCDWGTHIKTCWFAPYLPDLDWTNDAAAHSASDEVMWWLDKWDADGIRIDAVPMMPRSATRRIAASARKRYQHPGNHLYVLGENFTGPGQYQSLRYDLGPYGLDGSFHFPLMWTMREAIAHETQPLSSIDESYREGEAAWDGSNAVMGLMIGNHDVSRFSSESAGDADGDVWAGPAQPTDPIVYAKQRLALATALTMPGAPVLYYGDEVGLAGRSDPDCRRVMPAEKDLSAEQVKTRAVVRSIGTTRSCSRALRRGTLTTMLADEEHYVFARVVDGESAIVALTRRPTQKVDVPLPPGSPTDLVEVLTGKPLTTTVLPVSDESFSIQVYVSAGSGCVVTQP